MTVREAIVDFLSQKTLALVGVSRSGNKFSNAAYRELKAKGYTVIPVNPHADSIDGERCYHRLDEIETKPDGVLIMTPPGQTEGVVREALDAGIRRVWMQQGAESETAAGICVENGVTPINGECIMMFAEPAAFYHKIHRFVWKLLGKLPA